MAQLFTLKLRVLSLWCSRTKQREDSASFRGSVSATEVVSQWSVFMWPGGGIKSSEWPPVTSSWVYDCRGRGEGGGGGWLFMELSEDGCQGVKRPLFFHKNPTEGFFFQAVRELLRLLCSGWLKETHKNIFYHDLRSAILKQMFRPFYLLHIWENSPGQDGRRQTDIG